MIKTDKIWLDGKFVDWDLAKVHILANALHYGSGVFEGIRCYKTDNGGAIFRLDEHIRRLFYSAGCMGIKIPYSRAKLKEAVVSLVKFNNAQECYIRPVAFCGYDKLGLDIINSKINTAIILWPWGAYLGDDGLSAIISSYRRLSPYAVPIDAKISGYYVNSIMASSEAKKRGADEAILLDEEGYVAEGPGENIFIVKNANIHTPPKGTILPGITRDSVMRIANGRGMKVIEKKISVKELKSADEAFFTGTAIGVCPVIRIDGQKVGKGVVGPITFKIKSEYIGIVRDQNPKYKKWLTLV